MHRIPILKMGRNLLVSIQTDLDDEMALSLQQDLTEKIAQTGARGALIDISSLDVVDSFVGRVFGEIASMARVMGTRTVLVGMRPAVAITLVELGLSLRGIETALTVEKGMSLLETAPEDR